MSGFYKKYVILKHALIFQFGIKSCFFPIPIIFTNFLVRLSSHFFDFWLYMAGKCIFVWEVELKFKKIKKCVFLKYALIFQFCIKSFLFSILIIFTNFLVPLSSHFFWFFGLYGRKLHFLVSKLTKKCLFSIYSKGFP